MKSLLLAFEFYIAWVEEYNSIKLKFVIYYIYVDEDLIALCNGYKTCAIKKG